MANGTRGGSDSLDQRWREWLLAQALGGSNLVSENIIALLHVAAGLAARGVAPPEGGAEDLIELMLGERLSLPGQWLIWLVRTGHGVTPAGTPLATLQDACAFAFRQQSPPPVCAATVNEQVCFAIGFMQLFDAEATLPLPFPPADLRRIRVEVLRQLVEVGLFRWALPCVPGLQRDYAESPATARLGIARALSALLREGGNPRGALAVLLETEREWGALEPGEQGEVLLFVGNLQSELGLPTVAAASWTRGVQALGEGTPTLQKALRLQLARSAVERGDLETSRRLLGSAAEFSCDAATPSAQLRLETWALQIALLLQDPVRARDAAHAAFRARPTRPYYSAEATLWGALAHYAAMSGLPAAREWAARMGLVAHQLGSRVRRDVETRSELALSLACGAQGGAEACYWITTGQPSSDVDGTLVFSQAALQGSYGMRFGPRFSAEVDEHLAILQSMRASGRTALYDAILTALDELSTVEGRKSLLVFTDGDDAGPAQHGSQSTSDDATEGAKLSEVTIYTVGFTGWGPEGSESVNIPFLTTLAEATGGRAFFPEDVEQVKDAFLDVQEDLHRHYRMAYIPSESPPEAVEAADETWRPLEVRVRDRDDLIVRTRQGYYARAEQSP